VGFDFNARALSSQSRKGFSCFLGTSSWALGTDRGISFGSPTQSPETLRVTQEVRKPSDHRLLMVGFEFTTKSTKSTKRLIFHSSPSCSSCPSW